MILTLDRAMVGLVYGDCTQICKDLNLPLFKKFKEDRMLQRLLACLASCGSLWSWPIYFV